MADDDGFVGATLEGERPPPAFDAGAYSFFGDLSAADDALEGALEEGLEAPPEEELPDPDLMLDADEDLSFASMFAAALEEAGPGDKAGKQGASEAGAGSAAPKPALGLTSTGGSLFQGIDVDAVAVGAMEPTPPRSVKPGSIALGGLLAGAPGSPFGSVPSSSPFGGFGAAPSPLGDPRPSPFGDPAAVHLGVPPPVVASLPGGPGPRGLTAQELEAQLLGGASASAGQQQALPAQHGPLGPPPQQPYPQGPLPPGYLGGMPPPPPHQANGFGGPPPPGPYGMPPPPGYSPSPGYGQHPPPGYGPPLPHPGQFGGAPPPPQYSPGAAFPPMHGRPPPRGPIPMQQPGMLSGPPESAPPPPPPGYGPQHAHMGGPHPPPGFPGQHMRPGPGGMPPPQHMRPGPPGPWGPRPPMGPAGMQQQRPAHLQPATLAQRLRALDLADRHEESYRRPQLRRRYYAQYMDHDEIEHILQMQWRPLHQGSPYLEDYYYQAFVYKYYAKRNRRFFAPESVRELAPTEKVAPDEVAFVKVEGLGRLPFSNIRRPRPLMDVAPEDPRHGGQEPANGEGAGEGPAGEGGEAAPARPLEQEPMLAARIMVEDCMCLILDVLDIDQIFVAAGGPVENEGALRLRRALLMDGLAASLRLPETPVVAPPTPGGAAAGAAGEFGDGVFLRLMALTKGRKLLARALRVVYPAPEAEPPRRSALVAAGEELPAAPLRPNLRVVWAALRSLRRLFCGQPCGTEEVAAAAAVAAALAELLRRLHSPQAVADCLAAVLAGDLDGAALMDTQPDAVLLPLYAPGANAHDTQRPWLADVLMALLQRAAELDLLPATVPAEAAAPAAAAWRGALPRLYALVERHVGALHQAFQAGMAMGEQEAAAQVKVLMPISLVRVLLPHCSQEQAGALRGMLRDLGV